MTIAKTTEETVTKRGNEYGTELNVVTTVETEHEVHIQMQGEDTIPTLWLIRDDGKGVEIRISKAKAKELEEFGI